MGTLAKRLSTPTTDNGLVQTGTLSPASGNVDEAGGPLEQWWTSLLRQVGTGPLFIIAMSVAVLMLGVLTSATMGVLASVDSAPVDALPVEGSYMDTRDIESLSPECRSGVITVMTGVNGMLSIQKRGGDPEAVTAFLDKSIRNAKVLYPCFGELPQAASVLIFGLDDLWSSYPDRVGSSLSFSFFDLCLSVAPLDISPDARMACELRLAKA